MIVDVTRSNIMRGLLLGVALAASIGSAPSALADTKPGRSEVSVIRPLSFIADEQLDFGAIVASNQAGTVTMAPDGSRTATNGIVIVGSGHSAASFAGWGQFNQRVLISLSSNTIWLTGPGPRMRLRTFTIGSTPTAVLTTAPQSFRIAGANGTFAFPVGATLEVGANQPIGKYTGTWDITLQYM